MERNEAKKQNIWIPAEVIGNNIDLLTEILLRLPVKPVVRAKCVSKQWLSIISDPQFCLSHNRHHNYTPPTSLLLRESWYPSPELEMIPLRQETIPKLPSFDYLNSPDFRIIQSCNGLFFCSSKPNNQFRLFGQLIFPEYNYYICNPATKQFKTLSFPSSEFEHSLVSVCMAFDPLKSNHYKLISIRTVKNNEKHQIDMYSSETDSWSMLGITFTAPDFMETADVVFCNGVVHWFIEDETSLYYHVDTQCLKTMPMPDLAEREVQYFGESHGHLHLIMTEWRPPLQFEVLEMAADYSGWFVKYHVNLDAVRIAFPDIIWHHERIYTFSVLHIIRAQKEEDSIVVIHVDDKAISYNVHDGTSKKLCDLEPHACYMWSDAFQYFEILAFV